MKFCSHIIECEGRVIFDFLPYLIRQNKNKKILGSAVQCFGVDPIQCKYRSSITKTFNL